MNRSEAGKLGYLKSKQTKHEQYLNRVRVYVESPKICLSCNLPLPYEKKHHKFCNHSCSASFNNVGYDRHNKTSTINTKLTHCAFCDADLRSKNRAKKYCSSTCQQGANAKVYIDRWLAGLETGVSGTTGTSRYIKNYLISVRGNKCETCGWCEVNPITNKVPIELEHSDGNWENNRPENLKLLCPNCHSLTPTYGSLNRGNGRKERKNTYAPVAQRYSS